MLGRVRFWPNQTTPFGVTCSWVTKISHIWTWISLKPVGQFCSNFMCSVIGVGERLHKVLRQIGSKLWFPWQQKAGQVQFRTGSDTNFGVTCPWMNENFTLSNLNISEASANLDQILCIALPWVGKGCIMFWGRLDQNSGVHGNRKPPLTYNGENGVSTFFDCFWSNPF